MRRIALVTLTVALLAGCSGGSDDKKDGSKDGSKDATASATPKPTGPPCAGIWKAGATLPETYKTCVLDGVNPEQEVYECTDSTKLISFNDVMYAVTGGKIVKPEIQPFLDTEEYGKVYAECTGE
ncbi:MAG: hypothetical protein ABIN55_03495 [Aeromicrobium sp.]